MNAEVIEEDAVGVGKSSFSANGTVDAVKPEPGGRSLATGTRRRRWRRRRALGRFRPVHRGQASVQVRQGGQELP